ncbi:collagen alpha-1(XVII) chain-like [Corticium candelabrum]|uniref:collagen alpha-1(XVII) chain-like n=1 Tax=Corticium candelabrum TaxID=121492 RepID=UPI002E275283|nr:collagen alpha-1(XVII) chain-like [Corticium candelabrum]
MRNKDNKEISSSSLLSNQHGSTFKCNWIIIIILFSSFLINLMFTGFVWLKLNSLHTQQVAQLQQKIDELQRNVAEMQDDQSSTSQMTKDINILLSSQEKQRNTRSESLTKQSPVIDGIASAFALAIKQLCKPSGAVCIAGPKGSPGRDGKGVPGLPGVCGAKGSSGKQGPKGVGEKGEMGHKGEMGMNGERGEKGDQGSPGAAGIQGGKGRKGDKGVNSDLLLPSPCYSHNHRVLNETWRKVSQHRDTVGSHCDYEGHSYNKHGFQPGWNRFSPTIGGAMLERCPSFQHCGTGGPGWLKGSHPIVIGQNVSQTVCFHYGNNCCRNQVTVQIINCGSYYVYNLPNAPACHLGYCGKAA